MKSPNFPADQSASESTELWRYINLSIIIIFFLILGRYIPEEGKKLMKKIGVWSSTNPGGQKTKNRRAKAPR